jgi:hypothetical protein
MIPSQQDRIVVVLMNNDPNQTQIWVQVNSALAKRYEFDKDKSIKLFGGVTILFLLMLYISPATVIILLLVSLIIIFPLSLVGMAGFSRPNIK